MSETQAGFFSAMLPTERRAISVIAVIAMCRMFGLFALLPVLAVYAKGLHAATPLLIGLAVGGYGLTQAFLQVPFGAWSDRIGRIPVIVFGLLLFAAGSVLAAESSTIWGVISGRLLQGAGAISATLTALLADATREQVRTRTMAVFGVSIGGSFLLALVFGPMIAGAGGVRLLFWMAAGLAVLAALLLFMLPPQLGRTRSASKLPLSAALKAPLLRLDLFVFLLHTILTATFVALPFVLNERLHMDITSHWHVYVSALLLSLVGTVPLIVSDERRGKSSILLLAVLLLLAGQLSLFLFGGSQLSVLLALAVFFAGFNFLEAALPARLSILAHGELRGASLGLFSSCQFFGAFAGGLLGGLLLGGGHSGRVFAACAALAALWLLAL
ncbi:MAG: MFS transporter, partial [Halioglobus sp.]|nr:MFS transporter [Halioglobus sp.]